MLLNIFQMFSELICSQKKERRENKELERKEHVESNTLAQSRRVEGA